jgi:hypothetical protein
MIPYIKTERALTFQALDGTPRVVDTDHKHFQEIHDIIRNNTALSEKLMSTLEELLADIVKLKRIANNSSGGELLVDECGTMTFHLKGYGDFIVPGDLAADIVRLQEENGSLTPFVNFLYKLVQNPDYRVVNQLWSFIKECGLCLTEDGNFMAYKNVNNDFTSAYDGKTDNTPGTTLSMPRNQVNNDPNQTCSYGLHFAAWGYLKHYAYGRKTVLLSISPADVVSIPTDYNNQKGRASSYRVVREVEQPDELRNYVVFGEKDDDGEDYDDYDDYGVDDYCHDCGSYLDDNGMCDCDEE